MLTSNLIWFILIKLLQWWLCFQDTAMAVL